MFHVKHLLRKQFVEQGIEFVSAPVLDLDAPPLPGACDTHARCQSPLQPLRNALEFNVHHGGGLFTSPSARGSRRAFDLSNTQPLTQDPLKQSLPGTGVSLRQKGESVATCYPTA